MKARNPETKHKGMTPLPPELEKQLPPMVQEIRAFYFSLSEEERRKLDEGETKPSVEKVSPKSLIRNPVDKPSKFCFECGERINRFAKFCEHCGVKQPAIEG